jgi:Flp pilus assembly protein TadG
MKLSDILGPIRATRLRQFAKDRRGAVIIYVTLGLTVFLGFSALAIDGSYLYLMSNRAQSAADAAALAAASQLPDEELATDAALDFAGKNLSSDDFGDVLSDSDITFGSWDPDTRTFTGGTSPADAVEVVVRMSDDNSNAVQLFFANAMGFNEAGVVASAVATTGGAPGGVGEACLQALNPSAADAFRVVGTAFIRGEGCNIQVDSCHPTSAFRASGTPDIDLTVELDEGGTSSGDLNICGGMSATPEVELPPEGHVFDESGEQLGDPFDNAPFDTLPAAEETASCDEDDFSASGNTTLWPGVYCGGISLTGNGTATLQPGTYYIKDGEFKVTGNRALDGDGVTFVLVGADANLSLGGVSSMALSAPTTGDYAGFVFFGDRNNPATDTHKIHGTPLGGMHGISYFPNADVELLGTAAVAGSGAEGTDDCSILIADTLFFNGTVDMNIATECSDYQGTPAFGEGLGPLSIKLVD